MKFKALFTVVLLIAVLVLQTACSTLNEPENLSVGRAPALEQMAEDGMYSYSDSSVRNSADYEVPMEKEDTVPDNTAERVIIWDASMEIEAKDAASLHEHLNTRAAELGGYEYTNNVRHYESYSVVNATFKVPPQNLKAFMAYAGGEGTVINSSLSSDDVTESYYDSSIRLDTKRKALEQYYSLLAGTKTVEEIVYVQRIIDELTEEIEALEGKLRMWDVLSDMATVDVAIRQQNDPVKLKRDINWSTLTLDDMGYLIKNGLVVVCGGALTALQWLAVILAVTAPLWIVALVVVWIFMRRRKKKREAARQDSTGDSEEKLTEDTEDPE